MHVVAPRPEALRFESRRVEALRFGSPRFEALLVEALPVVSGGDVD